MQDVDDLALRDAVDSLAELTSKLKGQKGSFTRRKKDVQVGQALTKDIKSRVLRIARELRTESQEKKVKHAASLQRVMRECNEVVGNFKEVMKESTESLEEEAPVSEAEKIQLLDMRHSQEMLEDNLLELKKQKVELEMDELVSIAGDIRTLVGEQQAPLNEIERNVSEANEHTEQGKKQLRKAYKMSGKIAAPIIGAAVGGIVLGPVGGFVGAQIGACVGVAAGLGLGGVTGWGTRKAIHKKVLEKNK